jgi:hypothetical protein
MLVCFFSPGQLIKCICTRKLIFCPTSCGIKDTLNQCKLILGCVVSADLVYNASGKYKDILGAQLQTVLKYLASFAMTEQDLPRPMASRLQSLKSSTKSDASGAGEKRQNSASAAEAPGKKTKTDKKKDKKQKKHQARASKDKVSASDEDSEEPAAKGKRIKKSRK